MSDLTLMRILLATTNPHKVDEIAAVFDEQALGAVELLNLAHLGQTMDEPVEDQPSFEGNAVLKARYYAKATKVLCLAEDSGLEVDALDGQPGVRSARFSGVEGSRDVVDPANNRLLLQRLKGVSWSHRTARFVCAMALCDPERLAPIALVRGVMEGCILSEADGADPATGQGRGDNGFGYDPIFEIDELGRTAAEVSPDEKNAVSHRGRAARLMVAKLRGLG